MVLVQLLVDKYGARLDIANSEGRTPRQDAQHWLQEHRGTNEVQTEIIEGYEAVIKYLQMKELKAVKWQEQD